MEVKIRLIHFDTTGKLEVFMEKKVGRLEKTLEDIRKVGMQLRLIRPATTLSRQTAVTVAIPGSTLFTERTCDTFKEGIDLCVDAMRVQISKYKGKIRAH